MARCNAGSAASGFGGQFGASGNEERKHRLIEYQII